MLGLSYVLYSAGVLMLLCVNLSSVCSTLRARPEMGEKMWGEGRVAGPTGAPHLYPLPAGEEAQTARMCLLS